MTMKKVININFQGRVIPIEETAYELLKQYIDSLRRYFANEEGRDEIVNDIEGRIAELFSERLKKGSTCITDDDVNAVIVSMGRPEDFEAADAESNSGSAKQQSSSYQQSQSSQTYSSVGYGRLTRNADDKILGGVCSGLANYFRIDPVIMRIIFVLLFGALFWVYILLWIIIPSQSAQTNITKRLYRSADDRVISGVCGGLAAYFNIDTWIPRLIFALPLILGLISGPFNIWWGDWDWWMGPRIITGSLSSTLFVTYIILWIAVPVAVTAAEKLEMKGERIDLNSIRNTVKEDLGAFKSKAEKWGSEVKQSAQEFGEKAKEFGTTAGSQAKTFASEAAPIARSAGRGIGHVIGVLFKAFFLFIAGMIALSLFGALIGFLFGGFFAFPIKDFFLEGFWQNMLAWGALILFLGVPIVALITWLVRRIMGVRSRKHYLGYVFGSLWIIGLFCAILLGGAFFRNFKTRSAVEEKVNVSQPSNNKLFIDVSSNNVRYYGGDWFGIEWDEDWPIYGINQDTLMLNTVRVNIVKSKDDEFHITKVRFSRGNNPDNARMLAEKIRFDITQKDSLILLSKGFPISKDEKFRNQQVLVVIEVPVGKKIQVDRSIDDYHWFTVNVSRRRGWNIEWDENWDHSYSWSNNVEYTMTPDNGLIRTDNLDPVELKNGRFKMKKGYDGYRKPDADSNEEGPESERYRYNESDTSAPAKPEPKKQNKPNTIDTIKSTTSYSNDEHVEEEYSHEKSSSRSNVLYIFSRMFQQ
jgi:phage shock protein PspC (stress-responsive transcriptional regulator)